MNWILEDDLDPDDVARAAIEIREAIDEHPGKQGQAAGAVRWLATLLKSACDHGCGLSSRFEERIGLRDRY